MRLIEDEINGSIRTFEEFDHHERILRFEDKPIGLKGFIAIHNTSLGPAVGGTRYWLYSSEKEALRDVLNLSRAMTYKCAIAGVSYGGGKGVIIAHPSYRKTEQFLRSYGKSINSLNGKFYTGEDVGIDENDVKTLVEHSKFIIGRPGGGGDPSPWAALGVFYAIQASLKSLFGSDSVKDRLFAIKGVGKVGGNLCRLLIERGAYVTITDVNPEAIRLMQQSFPSVKVVEPSELHRLPVDVYSPCALGSEFTEQTVSELRCKIICGGANNQLASREIGKLLFERGIVYVPDYLANGGGLINVVAELDKDGYSRENVERKVRQIYFSTKTILSEAMKENKPTNVIADSLAQKVFRKEIVIANEV